LRRIVIEPFFPKFVQSAEKKPEGGATGVTVYASVEKHWHHKTVELVFGIIKEVMGMGTFPPHPAVSLAFIMRKAYRQRCPPSK
jgi:hypothetical protein